ncbi:hypothetical protein PybrP1_001573 [[Pythium] brassicae (nom. inval.)]|nr:hypothetical protein PybrP1_001573 [[Pythium] brassicae (nom. inval.)]
MGALFSRQPVTVSPQTHHFQSTTQAGTLVYVALSNKTHRVAPLTESCRIENTLFFGLKVRFDDIAIEAQIGTGNFGVVYKALYQGKHVAVKRLLTQSFSKKSVQDFQREISILSILAHPSVVQFLGAVTEPPTFCILTELCAGSLVDLLQLAQSKRLNITWGLTLDIALDCAKACNYLHTLTPAVLHRDIKKPYLDQDPINLAYMVAHEELRPELRDHIPEVLMRLMRACWEEDPTKRPSFGTIMFLIEEARNVVPLALAIDLSRPYAESLAAHGRHVVKTTAKPYGLTSGIL